MPRRLLAMPALALAFAAAAAPEPEPGPDPQLHALFEREQQGAS